MEDGGNRSGQYGYGDYHHDNQIALVSEHAFPSLPVNWCELLHSLIYGQVPLLNPPTVVSFHLPVLILQYPCQRQVLDFLYR